MGKLLIDRLLDEVVLLPGISARLVGYMAWPNDEEARTAWLEAHETSAYETSSSVRGTCGVRAAAKL
jgi:hypothetical protein